MPRLQIMKTVYFLLLSQYYALAKTGNTVTRVRRGSLLSGEMEWGRSLTMYDEDAALWERAMVMDSSSMSMSMPSEPSLPPMPSEPSGRPNMQPTSTPVLSPSETSSPVSFPSSPGGSFMPSALSEPSTPPVSTPTTEPEATPSPTAETTTAGAHNTSWKTVKFALIAGMLMAFCLM